MFKSKINTVAYISSHQDSTNNVRLFDYRKNPSTISNRYDKNKTNISKNKDRFSRLDSPIIHMRATLYIFKYSRTPMGRPSSAGKRNVENQITFVSIT